VDLTKEEMAEIRAEAFSDHVFFCRTFLTDWFPNEITWVHRGLMAILTKNPTFLPKYGEVDLIIENFLQIDGDGREAPIFAWEGPNLVMHVGQNTSLALPRGFGKTTVAKSVLLRAVLYQVTPVILYVSETATHANKQLADIKGHLESNPLVTMLFGSLASRGDPTRPWTEEEITTSTNITVIARGGGQQVRGINRNGKRPGIVLIDDFEDSESVATPEQRAKRLTWFYSDLVPVVSQLDPDAFFMLIGTVLHPEAVLPSLPKDPTFTCMVFGVLDKRGAPIWPRYMDLIKLEAMKTRYALLGKLGVFYREYFSKVIADETRKFRKEYFKHDRPEDVESLSKAMVIDPAISEKLDADFCAIAVVGMDPKSGHIWVLDMVGGRGWSPRKQVDEYFRLAIAWNCQHHGVESIAYQAALVHLLREEMFRKKKYFQITPITHTQKKSERIEGVLQPRYANGYVHHAKIFPELETQLADWPMGKRDFPDAVAMAVTLLDPHAAFAAQHDPTADEYEPLDEPEEVMEL
jgi:hypothetical protein